MLRSDQHGNLDDCAIATTGGGVALYIKEGLTYERYTLIGDVDPGIETLCIVVKVEGKRFGLCVVYRPPNVRYTSLSAFFQSLFVDLAMEVDTVMCLGDINIDLLSKTCSEARFLRRLLKESSAIQLVKEPTRITATSATLLDHIIVDRSAEVERTGVIDTADILDHRGVKLTDHRLIHCTVEFTKKEKKVPKMIVYRDFSKFSEERAVAAVAKVDWDCVMNIDGVDNIEQFITTNVRRIFDEQAPLVCKRVTKENAPWKNNDIIKMTKVKNKLRRKYWKTRANKDWDMYKKVRNELNHLIWKAKKVYFTERLSGSSNPKDFWTCLKKCNVVGKLNNKKFPCQLNINNINKYFIEMGSSNGASSETTNHFMMNRKNGKAAVFNFSAVSLDDVKSAMNEIKSRATGSDEISIQMIKAVSPYALKAITHLINESLTQGMFPQRWKKSIVHPLPKVPTPHSVNQFRPISILPAISKILEKLVTRQLTQHINEQNILPKNQSGFRKNHSTCTALTNLFCDLIDAKDTGKYSSVVMLDYSQAFDSISHNMLLAKMHFYGFGENAIEWVKSYLGGRSQVTKLENEISVPLVKTRGVPQGSCLGPVLFNLYTSDFPACIKYCTAHLYADDCQLHLSYDPSSICEAIAQLNSDLANVSKWSVDNGLKLNVDKCTVLHVIPHDLVQTLTDRGVGVALDGEFLTVCDQVKTLGILLDNSLSFSDHVTNAIQRAIGRLRGLYRFRSLLPEYAKLQLMQSMVLSVIFYCYPAYGNSISRGDVDRIQRLQNAAVRFIFNLRRFDHVSPFRDAVNLQPMEAVCRMLTSCMVHKVLSHKEPQYLSERLVSREEVSQRSTRHGSMFSFRKVKHEYGRKSFSYFGPKLYNGLPHALRECAFSTFKTKLRDFILTVDN